MTDPSDTHAALVADVAAAGSERRLDAGTELCREGDSSAEAYVVVSGRLDACVEGFDGEMTIAEHGPGTIVGEVTTLIEGRRSATLRAATDTTVAVVDRATLRNVLDAHPTAADELITRARERTERSRVASLLSSELQATDGDAVAAIAEAVTWTRLDAGEVLFRRGDEADAAYLVVSGRLGLTDVAGLTDDRHVHRHDPLVDTTPEHAESPTHFDLEVGRGAIVGEFGLMEGRERSATVTALRDTTLARLAAADFTQLSIDHTTLAIGLVRRVLDRSGAEQTRSTPGRSFSIATTATLDAAERARILAVMASALERCGTTAVLDADRVDSVLAQPGIADTAADALGDVRVSEVMYQSESEHDLLMVDVGTAASTHANWTKRGLQHTDQVVIVCSPRPDADEAQAIDRLLALAPRNVGRWLVALHPPGTQRPTTGRALRNRFDIDEVHHVRADADVERVARLAAGRGIGLVLSGGGARGYAHIGLIRAMSECGIPVDRVVGASMGSIVAATCAQHLDADELVDAMRKGGDLLDYTLPIVSVVKAERIVEVLENQFDGIDIDDLWLRFACVSTDLTSATTVVHQRGDAARAIRSSISIPGVMPPVVAGDHFLADGGVLENLPVGVLADDASIATIIACDVAPPAGPTAKNDYGLSLSGWHAARTSMGPKWLRRGRKRERYPSLSMTLMRAMLIGSSRSRDDYLADGLVDLLVQPDVRSISLLDFTQVDDAVAAGYDAARGAVADWLAVRNGDPFTRPADSPSA